MEKNKLKIRDLTAREHYSLQDVSQEINVPKRDIMNYTRSMGMIVQIIFNKYTVFTKAQTEQLRNHFKNKEIEHGVTDSNIRC